MVNNNAYKFKVSLDKLKAQQPGTMKAISIVASGFFKESFANQGKLDGGLKKWKPRKFNFPGKQRAILTNRGNLRDSLRPSSTFNKALVRTSKPYAIVHNEGGAITITPKMRRFFWAMYYQSVKKIAKTKAGKSRNTKSNITISATAQIWKSLALHKSNTLKIDQRPYMYHSKELTAKIDRLIDKLIKSSTI